MGVGLMRSRCKHCRSRLGALKWTVQACADGRRRRAVLLCAPCDIELNRLVMRYLRIRGAEAAARRYAAKMATKEAR